jgi:hypothetical protein
MGRATRRGRRRVVGTPHCSTTADTAELEPQEAEALASAEVCDPTLLFIDLDLQFGQFLPQPFFNRHQQAVMSPIGVDPKITQVIRAVQFHFRTGKYGKRTRK